MCTENCNSGFDQNDRIEAVRERIVKMVDGSVDAIEAKIGKIHDTVEANIANINAALFDGIVGDKFTGEDLQNLIVEGDVLSLEGFTERPDVKAALKLTSDQHVAAFQEAIGVGGKVSTAENAISDYAENLWDDFVIAGVLPDDIVAKLNGLEEFIKTTIDSL